MEIRLDVWCESSLSSLYCSQKSNEKVFIIVIGTLRVKGIKLLFVHLQKNQIVSVISHSVKFQHAVRFIHGRASSVFQSQMKWSLGRLIFLTILQWIIPVKVFWQNQCGLIKMTAGKKLTSVTERFKYEFYLLTLLHSEQPKLYRVLAILSAVGLIWTLGITKTWEIPETHVLTRNAWMFHGKKIFCISSIKELFLNF